MQIRGATFCLSSIFYLNRSGSGCSFLALDSGSEPPRQRAGILTHRAVSLGTAFTKQRVMALTKPTGG